MGVQETIHETGAERARFREMKQGTAEDWAIIGGEYRAFAKGLPDRVLDHARIPELSNPYFGKVRDCYDLPDRQRCLCHL